MRLLGLRVAAGAVALAAMSVAVAQDKPSTRPQAGESPTTKVVGIPSVPHWDDLPSIPKPFTGTTRPVPSYEGAVPISSPASLDEMRSMQREVEEVVKKVTPATVCLQIGPASGSGVIVSPDGWIITAGHVSDAGVGDNASRPDQPVVIVLHDGRRVHGVTLGANRTADNGLVRITDPGPWPYAEIGESGKLQIGQWLVAIGHPGGYKAGRAPVVRLGRLTQVSPDTLHTDNTLVGGDSGGPLFDLQGRVVGIHSRISLESAVENMHITVDSFIRDWDRLSNGDVWGRLGGGEPEKPYVAPKAALAEMGLDQKEGKLLVAKITPGGAADLAGLRAGDVILSVDGKPTKFLEFGALLKNKKGGEVLTLSIQRKGAEDQVVKLRLKPPYQPPAPTDANPKHRFVPKQP